MGGGGTCSIGGSSGGGSCGGGGKGGLWNTIGALGGIIGIIYGLFFTKKAERPKPQEVQVNNFSRDLPVPLVYGIDKFAGTCFYLGETGAEYISIGAKGIFQFFLGGLFGNQSNEFLIYYANFCVCFGEGKIGSVMHIYVDDEPIEDPDKYSLTYRLYLGDKTQGIDPSVQSYLNGKAAPGIPFRNTSYAYLSGTIGMGNIVPNVTAEVSGLLSGDDVTNIAADWTQIPPIEYDIRSGCPSYDLVTQDALYAVFDDSGEFTAFEIHKDGWELYSHSHPPFKEGTDDYLYNFSLGLGYNLGCFLTFYWSPGSGAYTGYLNVVWANALTGGHFESRGDQLMYTMVSPVKACDGMFIYGKFGGGYWCGPLGVAGAWTVMSSPSIPNFSGDENDQPYPIRDLVKFGTRFPYWIYYIEGGYPTPRYYGLATACINTWLPVVSLPVEDFDFVPLDIDAVGVDTKYLLAGHASELILYKWIDDDLIKLAQWSLHWSPVHGRVASGSIRILNGVVYACINVSVAGGGSADWTSREYFAISLADNSATSMPYCNNCGGWGQNYAMVWDQTLFDVMINGGPFGWVGAQFEYIDTSAGKGYEANPIEVVYDIMTNTRYGMGIAVDRFDGDPYTADSGTWRSEKLYCDERVDIEDGKTEARFTYSKAQLDRLKGYDLIREVLQTCRGFLYYCDGKIKVKIEKPGEEPQIYFGLEEESFVVTG